MKSRVFVLVIGILFVIMVFTNIWRVTMGDGGVGIVLFEYTFQNEKYTWLKRPTQRSMLYKRCCFQ